MGDWTLFSNHGHVLLFLAGHRDARLRDVAERVGITERAVQKIVRELQAAGYLSVTKHGRCNRYRINARKSLRHPIEAHCPVARLVQLIVRTPGTGGAIATEAPADPAQITPERLPGETAESAPQQGRKPRRPAAEQPAGQANSDHGKAEADEPLGKRQQRSLF